jgi:hypothetical protein
MKTHRAPFFVAMLAAGSLVSVATAQTDQETVQTRGPIRLSPIAALVAPGKADGRHWDGTGRLAPELLDTMRSLIGLRAREGGLSTLFSAAAEDPRAAIATVLPGAVRVFDSAITAPDVYLIVRRNGSRVIRTPVVHELRPTWGIAWSRAIRLGANDVLEVQAIDEDAAFDDHIGTCTSRGTPSMSRAGYMSAASFTCHGQLLGIAIMVRPEQGDPFRSTPTASH